MKKALLAVLAVLVFCSAGMAAIKDSPDGFRGIKWGQPPSALGKYTLLENTGGQAFYLKNGDKLKIGDADLTSIMYVFWENKFMTAVILTEGFGNSSALKAAMIARYGEPQPRLDNADKTWEWHDDNVVIRYGYTEAESQTYAIIASKPLLLEQIDQKEAAAQKGAKDF